MKQRKANDRVLMIRVGGACDTTLEVRVGSQDPDNHTLPYSGEFAGTIRPGKRFLAQYGCIGINFPRHYSDRHRWDFDSLSIGYHSNHGGDFFNVYTAETLVETLKWMGKQVYGVMERTGHPGSVDEAVAMIAQAWDVDAVFVRNLNGDWHRYTEAVNFRHAIRDLEKKVLEKAA